MVEEDDACREARARAIAASSPRTGASRAVVIGVASPGSAAQASGGGTEEEEEEARRRGANTLIFLKGALLFSQSAGGFRHT